MKIEVDDVYCCDRLMEKKEVIDAGTKKRTLVLICNHCKNVFEIEAKHIKEQPQ